MSSTNTDETTVLDTGRSGVVWAVAFQPDGKHILGGSSDGIRQWQLSDGQEVGKQTGMDLNAISVSRDHKWILCGTYRGASVWDGELHEKVIEDNKASIWSITSGERLVGPLEHVDRVIGVKFSPDGEHVATACNLGSIRIFDSRNGAELINIETVLAGQYQTTPLAWSGQQISSTSNDNKIRSFNVSTGSQLAESPILHDGNNDVCSIALAANGKFIVAAMRRSISFLDTSTLTQIGSVIEDDNDMQSIAVSLDNHYLATGRYDGKIVIRHLYNILPESYGPFNEDPSKPSLDESKEHAEDNDDLLEHEVPSSAPAPEFDYDEPPSPASSGHPREDEGPSFGPSDARLQSTSTPEARVEQNLDTTESRQGRSIFKRFLRRKSPKEPTSHKPDRHSGKSRQPANRRSPSRESATVDATNEGPARMAAGQRQRRAVAKPVIKQQHKSLPKAVVPKRPRKTAPRGEQRAADPRAADPTQQANDASQPSSRVHLTHRPDTGDATLAITFPAWLLCFRSGTHDGPD